MPYVRVSALLIATVVLIFGLGVLTQACSDKEAASISEPLVGLITDLQTQGDELVSITVEDLVGKVHVFPVDKAEVTRVSVAHLRIHQSERLPVSLVFARRDGRIVVTKIDDFVPATVFPR